MENTETDISNMPVILRNKLILKYVLTAGASIHDCIKKYNVSYAMVSSGLRSIMEVLKEHTDMPLEVSAAYDYLQENKETILRYINEPIPQVNITHSARIMLREKFGKYYAKNPAEVAARWSFLLTQFNCYRDARDLRSIQKWLASEGHLAGDYVTEQMQDIVYEKFSTLLKYQEGMGNGVEFKVTKTSIQNKSLVLSIILSCGEHRVAKEFKVEMIGSVMF